MALRVLRAGVALLLGASGALMYAASWQRWTGACPWGGTESGPCLGRQDHLYDFLVPSAPWQPVGDAAQLGGLSLLVLAVAFLLLPWALTGRRPDAASAVALLAAGLATAAVGVATLRSGLEGSVVDPVSGDLAVSVWFLVPPVLLVRFAAVSRGWALAGAVSLILASPIVAFFTYAVGAYDSKPWSEAVAGILIAGAGLCLLGAAVFSRRPRPSGLATASFRVQRPGLEPTPR